MASRGPGEDYSDAPIEAELALADRQDRLPWLESDDDFEPAGQGGGRAAAMAAIALLVALVAGAAWWWTAGRASQAPVANGGVIAAPSGPYKIRPDDPGGMQVEGTDDASFKVAEGVAVDSRIAGSGALPAPSIDLGEENDAPPVSSGAVGVQVGAYFSRAAAEEGWTQLTGRLEALQGRSHRVLQGVADSGTIFRLQALAGSADDADGLCRAIKDQGGDCQVKR